MLHSTLERVSNTPFPQGFFSLSKVMQSKSHPALESLPAEIIQNIFTLLPPLALVALSQTSSLLRSHSQNDLLWATFVQNSVPNSNYLTPTPGNTWREFYISHHPFWFLPRRKLWFSDRSSQGLDMFGQVVIARYHPFRNYIAGYRLLAQNRDSHLEVWEGDSNVIIHTFNPIVSLHLENPFLEIRPGLYRKRHLHGKPGETAMLTDGPIGSSISLCSQGSQRSETAMWPPPILPSTKRVSLSYEVPPGPRCEINDCAFKVRRWFTPGVFSQIYSSQEESMTFSTLPEESYTPTKRKPWQGIWVGDYTGHGCEFLVILQKDVDRQSRIPVSSWSPQPTSAGSPNSENNTSDETHSSLVSPIRETAEDNESATFQEGYLLADAADGSCMGRLEAIKLTGDPNVPRGEYTWIAEDIGPKGLIRIANEQMFNGARVVRSLGHIANEGFENGMRLLFMPFLLVNTKYAAIVTKSFADRYIASQLIMISHDSLAQYWEVRPAILILSRRRATVQC